MKRLIFLFLFAQIVMVSCEKEDVNSLKQLSIDLDEAKVGPTSKVLAPKNLAGTVLSPTSISLTWKDNSTNETGFTVERKVSGGSYSLIATLPVNTTSFIDNGLNENDYVYRIKVFNSSSSAYSNEFSISLVDVRSGLVAFYPLDGNANDLTNTYNGTIVGPVTFINNRNGVANAAMQGGSGYITASTSVFQFDHIQPFSVSAWFATNGYTPGRLMSTENSEGNFRIAYFHDLGSLVVQFSEYLYIPVTNGAWTHLVWTNSNGVEKVYLNGQLVATQTETTFEGLHYGAPFTIGAKAASAYDNWNGKIDDIGVWNRELTDKQVAYLYSLNQFPQ